MSLLDRLLEDDGPPPKLSILPEAAIERLREAHAVYGVQRFHPGDLVTPRADGPLRGAGDPHLVLETNYGAEPTWMARSISDLGSNRYGNRLDLRCLSLTQERDGTQTLTAHWNEAWLFVPWEAPTS